MVAPFDAPKLEGTWWDWPGHGGTGMLRTIFTKCEQGLALCSKSSIKEGPAGSTPPRTGEQNEQPNRECPVCGCSDDISIDDFGGAFCMECEHEWPTTVEATQRAKAVRWLSAFSARHDYSVSVDSPG